MKTEQILINHRHEMIDKAETYYISYVNEFLSIEGFASYYGVSEGFASKLLSAGKAVNDLRSKSVLHDNL